MAENNMGVETGLIGEMPKIEISNSATYSGTDIDRMKASSVPGGGSQLEHLGEKSQYPRIPSSKRIDYINQSSFTQSDIDNMRQTKAPGGGSQLEHLGEHSRLPKSEGAFRRIMDRWFRKSTQEIAPSKITQTITEASKLVEAYNAAASAGDKASQSALIKSTEALMAKGEPIPIPIPINSRRNR